MDIDKVLTYYGGKEKSVSKTAHALGISTQCIYGWKEKKRIPKQSQILIELHSKGKFKAEKH